MTASNATSYRKLFDQAPIPMFVYDRESLRLLAVNNAAARGLGRTPDELIGIPAFDLLPTDIRSQVEAKLATAEGLRSSEHWEFRLERHDDQNLIVHLHTTNIEFDGHPARLVVATDVTQLHALQTVLNERERRFRVLVENSLDIVTELDLDGTMRYQSPAFATILGYDPEVCVGLDPRTYLHPEDLALFQKHLARLREGQIERDPIIYRMRHREGPWVYLESVAKAVVDDGAVTGFAFYSRDITERVKLEERLRRTEAQFRTIFEGSAVPILFGTLHGGEILNVNPAFEHVFGYTPEEIRTLGLIGLTHPDDRATDAALFAEVVAGATDHYSIEKRYLHKNGSVIWGHLTISLIREAEDTPHYIVAMIQDITARKDLEVTLRQSEEQFRQTFEHAAVGMVITTPTGEILTINPALREILGYSEDEMIGLGAADFIHPEDTIGDIPLYRALLAGEVDHYRIDKRFLHKSGRTVWSSNTVSLVRDTDGQPRHVIGLVEDITARKATEEALRHSEERFRSIFEHSPDLLTMADRQGVHTFVGGSVADILGYTAAELTGQPIFESVHPDDRQAVLDAFADVRQTPDAARTIEYRARHKDGSFRTLDGRIRNLFHHPAVNAIVMHARDVTARRETDARLVEMEGMIHNLSLTDPTSGYHNRIGFLSYGEQTLQIVLRLKHSLVMTVVRLGNLAEIRQTHGFEAGDEAIASVAETLRKVFHRSSDVLARVADDEFAVLAIIKTPQDARIFLTRMFDEVAQLNATRAPTAKLQIHTGSSILDPQHPTSFVQMTQRAHAALNSGAPGIGHGLPYS